MSTRLRPRNTNGAVEPPFVVDRNGQAKQSSWARYHQWLCPCESLSPWKKLPGHLRDNEYLLRGYRAVRCSRVGVLQRPLLK